MLNKLLCTNCGTYRASNKAFNKNIQVMTIVTFTALDLLFTKHGYKHVTFWPLKTFYLTYTNSIDSENVQNNIYLK